MIQQYSEQQHCYLVPHSSAFIPQKQHFEPSYWQQQHALLDQAPGRGTTWFFTHHDTPYALRHYHRGGFMAKLSKDKYFYTGINRTRVYREMALLLTMQQQGLPVPQVFAGHIIRRGGLYQADLITKRIENTMSLADYLKQATIEPAAIRHIHRTIVRFHDANIFHSDLNARNILLDTNLACYLIDFDNSYRCIMNKQRRQANWQRLHRSLTKLYRQQEIAHSPETLTGLFLVR